MYDFPHGKEELEGIANRTDFDLGSHTKNQKDFDITANVKKNENSTTKLGVQNLEEKTSFIPYVIEPSAGVDRGVLAILNEAFTNEEIANGNSRIVLKLKPHLSPIKAAVIPLKKNNDPSSTGPIAVLNIKLNGLGSVKFSDLHSGHFLSLS